MYLEVPVSINVSGMQASSKFHMDSHNTFIVVSYSHHDGCHTTAILQIHLVPELVLCPEQIPMV